MKRILIIFIATLSLNAVVQAAPQMPAPGEKIKVHHMTPEMREKMKKRLGDRIPKPGSQKGTIVFINTQSVVPESVFLPLVASQAKQSGFNMRYVKVATGEPEALKASAKADIAVIIVADDKSPTLLAAIEDGWAVVNVKKLEQGLTTPADKEKFYMARCQKEVLRALVSVCGGMMSQYPGNIMDSAHIRDLDLCDVFIPADKQQDMIRYLAQRNVTPLTMAHYRQACQQGWAPPPTNDVQKAI